MRALIPVAFAVVAATAAARGDEWPQWRGPRGTGVAPDTALPARWTPADVTWQARLGGVGVSSPPSSQLLMPSCVLAAAKIRTDIHMGERA